MPRRNWVVIATAAFLAAPAVLGQNRQSEEPPRREGVRLPILGEDREPIDLLKLSPEEVKRELQQREEGDRSPLLASPLEAIPDFDAGVFPGAPSSEQTPEQQQAQEQAAAPPAAEAIEVKSIWVAESGPGAGTIPAQAELANSSERSHRLMYVYTDAAEETILHVTQWTAGVQQVQRLKGLHLPAEEHVHLRPGGPQLLLVDLRRPLSRGEAISVTLQFDDGSRKTVKAPVQSFN